MARGEVVAVNYSPVRPRPRFEATIDDGSGKLALVWFHAACMRQKLHPGMHIRVQGRVKLLPQLAADGQPEVARGGRDAAKVVTESKFRPIYPASLRLHVRRSSPAWSRTTWTPCWPRSTSGSTRRCRSSAACSRRRDAYRLIHRPADITQAMRARRRIIYDELMLMQLGLGLSRRAAGRADYRAGHADRQAAGRAHPPAFPVHADGRPAERGLADRQATWAAASR